MYGFDDVLLLEHDHFCKRLLSFLKTSQHQVYKWPMSNGIAPAPCIEMAHV